MIERPAKIFKNVQKYSFLLSAYIWNGREVNLVSGVREEILQIVLGSSSLYNL